MPKSPDSVRLTLVQAMEVVLREEGCVWGLRKKGVGHWDTPDPGSNTRTDHLTKDAKCLFYFTTNIPKYGGVPVSHPLLKQAFQAHVPL
jgi:hypothetical protein